MLFACIHRIMPRNRTITVIIRHIIDQFSSVALILLSWVKFLLQIVTP